MNINDAYPSKFLKASDLKGTVQRVKISRITYEEVGTDQKPSQKPVIYFEGKDRGLILNKTNGMAIAAEFGPETDGWVGATLELFSMKVPFQGQQVDSIRLRIPPPKPKAGPAGPAQQPAGTWPNARDRAVADMQAAPPANLYDDGLDDQEVPF